MFNPTAIFLTMWGVVVAFHAYDSSFYPFESLTWIIVATGVGSFLAGASLGAVVPSTVCGAPRRAPYSRSHISSFLRVCLWLYAAAVVATLVSLKGVLDSYGGVPTSGAALRSIVVADFLGQRVIFQHFRIFYLGVVLSLFSLAFASRLPRSAVLASVVLGLLCAVLTTGRIYLLLFVVAGSVLCYRQGLVSRRGLLMVAAAFTGLFLLIAILLGKGGEDASAAESIAWNVKIYLFSSLACFNDYVHTGTQHVPGGVLIPDFLRPFLNSLGASIGPKPPLWPFAFVPEPCNTYTVLFPYFHDGELVGVTLFMALAGALHQVLYDRFLRSSSPIVWYLFSISLYPLLMMVFEDAYLSSFGFWLMLLGVPLAFLVFVRICEARAASLGAPRRGASESFKRS